MRPVLIILFSIYVITGCSSSAKKTEAEKTQLTPPEKFVYGKILESVKCLSDSNQSYALYIPSSANDLEKFPVIFFFDPHATGTNPLRKYAALAEKYKFVLAASNNSQNGMDWNVTTQVGKSMMDDVIQRLNIDEKQVYTAGFSGGAKVAVQVANSDARVLGVIGCGAGFPETITSLNHPFAYTGMAGDGDFNYNELKGLEKALENSGITSQFIYFNGKHAWPTAGIFEEGILWQMAVAMREKRMTVGGKMFEGFIKNNLKRADSSAAKNDVLLQYQILKKIQGLTKNIYMVTEAENKIMLLEKSELLKKSLAENQKNFEKENQLKMYYQQHTNENNLWWKEEVDKIENKIKATSSSEAGVYKRVMAYLSILFYSYSNQSLQRNALNDAEKFISLFRLADAKNPDTDYLHAILMVKKGNNKEAISLLNEAVKLGFSDRRKLETDVSFSSIRNEKDFQNILSVIR